MVKVKKSKQKRGKRKNKTRKLGIPSISGRNLRGMFGKFDDPNPFPLNLASKLTYTEILQVAGTNNLNTVGTTYYFNLNSLFDPYTAVGGHQPYGFDQLCNSTGPYTRYKVNGVMVTITAMDPNADTTTNICVAVHPPGLSADTMLGLTLDQVNEKSNCITKYISNTGSQSRTIKQFFPMYKLFNVTKSQFNNDITNTTGPYNGNPGSMPTLEVGCCDPRAPAAATSVMLKVKLDYYAMFYERKQLSGS